jgi:ribosome maturation factor RimP
MLSRAEEELRTLVTSMAARWGLELVDLKLKGGHGKSLLRVDLDRPGPRGVTLEECQEVSHALGAALENGDVLPGAYTLEVSSPGLDRPIRTPEDVRRNTGRRVIVRTAEPIDGATSFSGVLLGLDDGLLRLRTGDETEVQIPFAAVTHARQEVEFQESHRRRGTGA